MKHIKLFEVFIGERSFSKRVSIPAETVNELNEIFLELTDMRQHYVEVDTQKIEIMKQYQDAIDNDEENFMQKDYITYTEEMAEVLIRVNDYLDSQGYDTEFTIDGNTIYPELGRKGARFILYFIKK